MKNTITFLLGIASLLLREFVSACGLVAASPRVTGALTGLSNSWIGVEMRKTRLLVLVFLLIGIGASANAVTVTASPGSCSSVAGIGTIAWANAAGATATGDSSLATASVDDNQVTRYLQCTGYNFAIPSGATITGITVNVQRSATASGVQDAAVRIVKAGVIGTADRSTSTAYTTSLAYEAHGSASDLWGSTWSASDINAANFGAAFAAQKPSTTGGARTVSVDHIQISVDYTVPFSCTQPSNTPAGLTLTCVCDTFGRTSLNPSTIYGADWIVSTSDTTGILPRIVNSGYLRLTDSTGDNAKAATVPGIFPAAGNYISVEFQQFAYNGSGADGVAVTLSDYSIPAVPGAFGGSLGYAQKNGTSCNTTSCPGFAGGWIGVALDEYGNYQNPTEGRIGGPGAIAQSVGVRGSGSGVTGYRWIAGTNGLSPLIDNRSSSAPSLGYFYQVIVDARNDPTSTAVAVNRDTGSGYTSLINIPNVYTAATAQGFTQAPVPANWQISFTGSTGGSTNIHEISGLRICAQTVVPPSGGTATGFNAVDEAYGTPPGVAVQNYLTGHIYTKLMGTAFKLNVAALNNNQIQTNYVVGSTSSKSVTVKLVDNSDGVCVLDSSQANYCSTACKSKTAVSGGSQTLTFLASNSGQKQSGSFTLNTAYKNLAAIISDGSVTACSTDSFAVRPTGVSSVISTNATNASASGTPQFKAGSDAFSLTATTAGITGNASGYTGILKINNAGVQAVSPALAAALAAGALAPTSFGAATSATGSSAATGTGFIYSEAGLFKLLAPDFSVPRIPAVYDDTWTAVDSDTSKNDCIAGTTAAAYSNTKDANGKYGCNFGLTADSGMFGRFIPDHFDTFVTDGIPCPSGMSCSPASGFTYSGQAFATQIIARNSAGATTVNYDSSRGYSKAVTLSALDAATGTATNPGPGSLAGSGVAASSFTLGVATLSNTTNYAFATQKTAPTTIRLRAVDTDGVSSLRATLAATVEGQTQIRSGQTRVSSAYGSELLPLPVNVLLQYWDGAGWVPSTTDRTTVFNSAIASTGNVAAANYRVNLTSVSTSGAVAALGFVNGLTSFTLAKPGQGKNGSVDLSINTPSYLPSVAGRATFGVYKSGPVIYIRENF